MATAPWLAETFLMMLPEGLESIYRACLSAFLRLSYFEAAWAQKKLEVVR